MLTGVSLASGDVVAGDVFVAVTGFKVHGATYAAQAVDAGAVAVLTDEAGAALLEDSGLARRVPVLVADGPARDRRTGRRVGARRARRAPGRGRRHGHQRQDHHHLLPRRRAARRAPDDRRARHRRAADRRGRRREPADHGRGARAAGDPRAGGRAGRDGARHGGLLARARARPGRRADVRRRRLHQPAARPPRLPRRHGRATSGTSRGCSPSGRRVVASSSSTTSGGAGSPPSRRSPSRPWRRTWASPRVPTRTGRWSPPTSASTASVRRSRCAVRTVRCTRPRARCRGRSTSRTRRSPIVLAHAAGVDLDAAIAAVAVAHEIPGRMERVIERGDGFPLRDRRLRPHARRARPGPRRRPPDHARPARARVRLGRRPRPGQAPDHGRDRRRGSPT